MTTIINLAMQWPGHWTVVHPAMPPRPEQATFMIGFAVSAALSLIAGLFLRKKTSTVKPDWTPTTLTTRGASIPLVLGRYRIGHIFAWSGNRRTKAHHQSGGKGFGGGSATSYTYSEGAMHILCIGPATQLNAIYSNGASIWSGPIMPANSPSGTKITTDKSGSFRIHWGEQEQVADSLLAANMGVASGFPRICYIVWDNFELGGNPNWPQLEYDVEATCNGTTFCLSSACLLDDGVSRGVNPAHALYQVLTGVYPWGIGLTADEIDGPSINAFGTLMEAEHLPLNMAVGDAKQAAEFLAGMMADAGFIAPQIGSRIAVKAIRPPTGAVPSFDLDVTLPPLPETTVSHDPQTADRLIFTFANEAENYKTFDVKLDDDGQADLRGAFNAQDVPISMATNGAVAARIAQRRLSEQVGTQVDVKLTLARAGTLIEPGDVFDVADIGRLRALAVTHYDDRATADIDASLDSYARPAAAGDYEAGGASQAGGTPEADIAFTWFELPAALSSSSSPTLVVLRERANQQIAGAYIWVSPDGTSYIQAGEQDASAAGGVLTAAMTAPTDDILATGPTYEAKDALSQSVLDLTSQTDQWQAGQQILAIGDEILFLKNISAVAENDWAVSTAYAIGDAVIPLTGASGLRFICTVAGTSAATEPSWPLQAGATATDGTVTWEAHYFRYTLNGLIRARYGSQQAAHAIGDQVYIIDRSLLTPITAPAIQPGADICIKTQPFTSGDSVALSSVTGVCKMITGAATGMTYLVDPDGDYLVDLVGDRVVG